MKNENVVGKIFLVVFCTLIGFVCGQSVTRDRCKVEAAQMEYNHQQSVAYLKETLRAQEEDRAKFTIAYLEDCVKHLQRADSIAKAK